MSFWTDDRTEKLKTLWNEGPSATEIGKKLGCTRNAVIGKAHRLNLPERKPSIHRPQPHPPPRPAPLRRRANA